MNHYLIFVLWSPDIHNTGYSVQSCSACVKQVTFVSWKLKQFSFYVFQSIGNYMPILNQFDALKAIIALPMNNRSKDTTTTGLLSKYRGR